MATYNKNFELSIEDMELIEDALRRKKRELSSSLAANGDAGNADHAVPQQADETVRGIHDLLGRIHNQKVFYRPRNATYISG